VKTNDVEPRLSEDDARFVAKLEALYRPPELDAPARARFAALVDERIARGSPRRPWLLAGAAGAAAAALLFALLPSREAGERVASPAAVAMSASTEEALLLLANGPLEDPDEALPEDYQTLASLLE
jgi:hypothetical protein